MLLRRETEMRINVMINFVTLFDVAIIDPRNPLYWLIVISQTEHTTLEKYNFNFHLKLKFKKFKFTESEI